jgi:hypothetical protein
MAIRGSISCVVLIWLLSSVSLMAQTPLRVTLSQPAIVDGSVQAFISVVDSAEQPIDGLPLESVTASLGATPLQLTKLHWYHDSSDGVATVLVLDVSKSVTTASIERVTEFARKLIASSTPADRFALLTFGAKTTFSTGFTSDTSSLLAVLDSLQRSDTVTHMHRSIIDALALAGRVDASLPKRRAVILLSDGLEDASGGPTLSEVTAEIDKVRIPIITMGFEGRSNERTLNEGLDALGVIARRTGTDVIDTRQLGIDSLYSMVTSVLRDVYLLEAQPENIIPEATVKHLSVRCTHDGVTVRTGVDVRAIITDQADSLQLGLDDAASGWHNWFIPLIVLALLGIAAWLFLRMRTRKHSALQSDDSVMQDETAVSELNTGRIIPEPEPATIIVRIEPLSGAENVPGT